MPDENKNPLEMSDEEMKDLPPPRDDIKEEVEEADPSPEKQPEAAESEAQEEAPAEEQQPESNEVAARAAPQDTFSDEGVESQPEESTKSNKKEDTKADEPETSIDYEAEYKKLTAPFKASGRQTQVNNVDDAITLMKMGADYNKKMAAMKPKVKLLKMLENNDLLDEEKLSYLIDLGNKKPEAINKLVKESGIDPLDIDPEKGEEYRPNTYTVDDKEVELDAVLDEIRDSPAFKDTINTISNKWDAQSKQVLLANPGVIKLINGHMESGIFQQITGVIDNERMLGRLQGMTDIEAYKAVGDALQEQGAFNQVPGSNEGSKDPASDKPKPDPKLNERRRAAAPTRTTPAKAADKNYNPLSMSDEEFLKVAGGG